jgi:hypothetical protein
MSLSEIATIVIAVVSAILGALTAAARLGRTQEAVARDVADAKGQAASAHARLDRHDARIVSLETTKAVDDERWRRVEGLLEEMREDVKELKGR